MTYPEASPQHVPPFLLDDMTHPVSLAPRRRRSAIVAAVALVVLLAVGVTAYLLTRPKAVDPLSPAALINACHTAAQAQMKTPATARFSGETTSPMSQTRSKVAGVVDAQNSLGALIRNRYTCEADKSSGGWTVVDVEFAPW